MTIGSSALSGAALASVLALGLVLAVGGSAQAIPPGTEAPTCADVLDGLDCEIELDALCAEIEESGDPLKQRDKDTMISKVVGASIKLDQGKTDDASQKLGDIQQKLDQLTDARKTKIADGDADDIQAALNAAQLCVDAIP